MTEEITAVERTELAECEQVIERGLQTFVDVGRALLNIRDRRLYRENHATFEKYCEKRWSTGRAHAYHLIDAAGIVDNLSSLDDILPEYEYQVRPLACLDPQRQREAWATALQRSGNEQPSNREVAAVVREMKAPPPTPAEMESEQRARAAERRAEQLLKERDEIQVNRYMRFRKLIEAVEYIAEFHMDSVADVWDGISNARGGEEVMANLELAQRCLARLRQEHPNAVRKPGIVLSKPS